MGAHVQVENTGGVRVGSQPVTVSAPAGFTFAEPVLYLWRDVRRPWRGQEEYPCTAGGGGRMLSCPDVPLDVDPGQSAWLYPQLSIASDATEATHPIGFTVGDPEIGSGDAQVEVTAAPAQQVDVIPVQGITGMPGEVRGAEVLVQNTGTAGIGAHTVTAAAPAGWSFTAGSLHLWRDTRAGAGGGRRGEETYPCTRSDSDRTLECADVPLNLAPGGQVVLYPQVRIADDAQADEHNVQFTVGEPAIGSGDAVITVEPAPAEQVTVTAVEGISGAPGDDRPAEVTVHNTGTVAVGAHTVTVAAPAGFAFTEDTLWARRTPGGETGHSCTRTDSDHTLTCPDVPLDLAPGSQVIFYSKVRIDTGTTPASYHISYTIGTGTPPVGTGNADIEVTGGPGPEPGDFAASANVWNNGAEDMNRILVEWQPPSGHDSVKWYDVWIDGHDATNIVWAPDVTRGWTYIQVGTHPGSYTVQIRARIGQGWGPLTPGQTVTFH